jgi:hypothetical protein
LIAAGCFDQPVSIMQIPNVTTKSNALANWILTRVTGVPRNASQEITENDFEILTAGATYIRRPEKM